MRDFIRLFEQVASERRDASAVVARDATLSFFALRSEARRLAEELRLAGVRQGDVVALSLGRTSLHVVGMLAVWYSQAAFLPIDPTAPEDRVRALLGESRARVLLVEEGARAAVLSLPRGRTPLGAEGDDLAYVIYTSGSTGRPKGVRVGHRGLCPVLLEQVHAFGLDPGKRALLSLSTAFDASISDIGTSLLSGATLVIAEESPSPAVLAERLRTDAITHADLPPSILPLVDPATLPPSLETTCDHRRRGMPASCRACMGAASAGHQRLRSNRSDDLHEPLLVRWRARWGRPSSAIRTCSRGVLLSTRASC